MIAPITPQTVARSFSDAKADYDMNRSSRFVRRRTGVNALGSGADYHFRNQTSYYDAIEQARDMDRNDAVIGILADRRVDNIVQQGFTLDPKTGDKGLDLELYNRWVAETEDADTCDIAGELTWKEIERHACRAESVDGDIIVAGTEDGPFQVIEAHLVQTETTKQDTFLGVTTDKYGKRTEYHIREETGEFGQKGESVPIKVRNDQGVRQLFHVYNPKRVTATRGVTQLAPVFAYAGILEDINFANLIKQQAVSCYAIIREQPISSNGAYPSTTGYGNSSTEITGTNETRNIEGVSPGMEIFGNPGEKITGFSPNIPGSSYFEQAKMMLQIIGVNFGLPLCLVLMDGSETNFSGWRGAVDEARKGFVADQINLVRRLNTPAYKWKVSQWVERDSNLKKWATRSGVNITAHNWNLPTWSYIEPVADAQGDAEQLKNCLTSPRRLHAARGKDWEELSEEIVDDNSYAIQIAMSKAESINKSNPTQPQVSWRDLLPLPMATGQTLALQDPAAIEVQQANAAAEGEPEKAGAEMLGVKRSDWKNSRKAINDILKELTSGTISEQRARVELDSIGVTPSKIDIYIQDVLADGTVDTPELQENV